jgi:hypothetical protein
MKISFRPVVRQLFLPSRNSRSHRYSGMIPLTPSLLLRAEIKRHNENLVGVAKQAGVVQPVGYAIFMVHG